MTRLRTHGWLALAFALATVLSLALAVSAQASQTIESFKTMRKAEQDLAL